MYIFFSPDSHSDISDITDHRNHIRSLLKKHVTEPTRMYELQGGRYTLVISTARDFRTIKRELLQEQADAGHSFLFNIDIISAGFQKELYSIHRDGVIVGFVLVKEKFSPSILVVWPRFRRQGIGAAVVEMAEAAMLGDTMHIEVSGSVGCEEFWTHMGYTAQDPEPWEGDIRSKQIHSSSFM